RRTDDQVLVLGHQPGKSVLPPSERPVCQQSRVVAFMSGWFTMHFDLILSSRDALVTKNLRLERNRTPRAVSRACRKTVASYRSPNGPAYCPALFRAEPSMEMATQGDARILALPWAGL